MASKHYIDKVLPNTPNNVQTPSFKNSFCYQLQQGLNLQIIFKPKKPQENLL
jgi:hypothetical protein